MTVASPSALALLKEKTEAAANRPLEHWTLRELLENPDILKPPPVVIPRLAWAERVSLLSAREKRGKSTLLAHGVAALTEGRSFLGDSTQASNALWVYYEGHVSDVVRTLHDAGADLDRVVIARGRPGEWEPLVALIQKHKPRATVIDTLASFTLGALVTESSKAEQWTPVMNQLGRLAQELHTAFLISAHDKKGGGGYADSRAIGAGVDMLLNMPGEPGDPSPKREITGVGRWPYSNCTIRLDGGRFVLDDRGIPSKELAVLVWIRNQPGRSKNAIREAIGGRKGDIDDAIESLERQGVVENRGTKKGAAYYEITAPEPAARGTPGAQFGAQGTPTVPDVAGQRLTGSVGTQRAPISGSLEPDVGTVPSVGRFPCPGDCGTTFAAPIKGLCINCRERGAA